ncbi:uncharacterized protein Z520_00040 [Fonsecaea multimorphosa CBS 102226]|uniref:Uncharacterized protein n=1 Tax=Fonsecaea multimorphosa CBS 102226 TaxID=1442371 RepID=A0A0D2L2T3_9EURO|nr:uncharacterized protein Z520_00040 [Fonsecaea multimorphosa CBS 102226]KIY03349.1 hypothetical protein Z520_00040 [Fonsecaea multimorphosa CBS 102226]OAL33000.1 hypothetical protein AYO22_00085 [Fonsecaea multimorphosa]
MQSLLKMFNLSNAPTVPLGDDELSADADEPPDDQVSPLTIVSTREALYHRSNAPPNPRRESLLTRAILAESKHEDDHVALAARGLSTTSSHSTASMPSTAELTSDGDTSQSRSATPSPPPPSARFSPLLNFKKPGPKVVIAPITKDEGEAAVEKTLGRKRCIMFACGATDSEKSKDSVTLNKQKPSAEQPEVPKRKCAITFACPSRTSVNETKNPPAKLRVESKNTRRPSPAPFRRKSTSESVDLSGHSVDTARVPSPEKARPAPSSPKATFHEFAASQDETDSWVDKPDVHKEKLTLDDCMKKENRIRQIGREAEEEAEEEEREQEELGNASEDEDNDNEDDFAPSDDGTDGGNESDDEGGFASSDEESDGGSEYGFWAPSNTRTVTGSEHVNISHFSARRQSDASSVESLTRSSTPPLHSMMKQVGKRRNNAFKVSKMRPGTPELPDSTDFVCGTLDEDRPLEAAYISCREQKKREKHIPIPQDIDPSFPTSDPEDDGENSDEEELNESHHSSDGPRWLKDGFADFDEEHHGRRKPSFTMPIAHSPSPPRTAFGGRVGRSTHRSPPPKHAVARSPPARKLFGHSPTRLRSPFPAAKLRSPRGSPTNVGIPTRINLRGLAQRPTMERTASLPDTPNPFFKNFHIGSPSISNIASGAVSPAAEEPPRPDMHVRGPVDIVAGLEKKRQKRKEKYWRQHCRKAAKEQAERKPVPGRGAERMKELGLECAERTKGYGIGQQTQLVLSL